MIPSYKYDKDDWFDSGDDESDLGRKGWGRGSCNISQINTDIFVAGRVVLDLLRLFFCLDSFFFFFMQKITPKIIKR